MAKPREERLAPRHFIREWRKHRNMTQEALAAAAGLSPGAISQFENGLIAYTQTTLEALAVALDVQAHQLLGENPKVPMPWVTEREEIRSFVNRIAWLNDADKNVVMATIANAIDARRAGSAPLDNRGQPLPASPRRELEPSGSKSRPPSS